MGPKTSGPIANPRNRTVPYTPMATPRVELAERSPNTTPMATNAVAMKGVPMAITIAGHKNPVRCPSTMLAADHTITATKTIGQRCRARSTSLPPGSRETPLTTAWMASK
jgi:hypothetical protein